MITPYVYGFKKNIQAPNWQLIGAIDALGEERESLPDKGRRQDLDTLISDTLISAPPLTRG